ncbi:MAG: hypothetical protein JRG74_10025 [Deltaproteobacteria bacterium]|nr:hypothetical protein [Deltaproteobacteria bacterium]
MSDYLSAIMIICITVIIVFIIFRNKLKSFSVKWLKLIFKMKTHEPSGTDAGKKPEKGDSNPTINQSSNGNTMIGVGNKIVSSIKLK